MGHTIDRCIMKRIRPHLLPLMRSCRFSPTHIYGKKVKSSVFGPRTGKMARVGLGNTGTVQVKHERSDSRSGDEVRRTRRSVA